MWLPFYLKTKRSYPNKYFPIAGVFSIHKSGINILKKADYPTSIRIILENNPLSFLEKQNAKQTLLKNANKLYNSLSFYELSFKKDISFWSLIKERKTLASDHENSSYSENMINKNVKKFLPADLKWESCLVDHSFFEKVKVIKEQSWLFEFDKVRQLPRLSQIIFAEKKDSNHSFLVRKYFKKLKNKDVMGNIFCLKYNNNFVLIDGNHTAIAMYRKMEKKKTDLAVKINISDLKKRSVFI